MTDRGHRILDHTADIRLEAWGPTRAACFEEAVGALVGSFAELGDVAAAAQVPVSLGGARADADVLIALLEEVVFHLDVDGVVPVEATLSDGADGTVSGTLGVVPVDAVEPIGAGPKGIVRDAEVACTGSAWRASVTVDV